MVVSRWIYRMVWVKCTTSASVIYSNSRVLGHGRLEWPYLTCVEFLFYKIDSWENGVCAGRSTWRVLSWHRNGSEYSKGTAEVRKNGHVWLTMVAFGNHKGVSPFPRAFTKTCLTSIFFNKDIEMSYDMLYRHEEITSIDSLQPSQPLLQPNSIWLLFS
jgi:hypothetical protein